MESLVLEDKGAFFTCPDLIPFTNTGHDATKGSPKPNTICILRNADM